MRHLTLASAAIALLVFGAAVPAAAQNPNPGMSNQGHGMSVAKPNLSPSQGQGMMHVLRGQQPQSPPAGFDGHVGSTVPDSMSAQSLPSEATDQAPGAKGLLFVRLPDRVLLIDPDNKAVLEIVGDETTGSGANSDGSGGSGPNQPASDDK
jgi:hypothetical protein